VLQGRDRKREMENTSCANIETPPPCYERLVATPQGATGKAAS
jgi:hypothetical protein